VHPIKTLHNLVREWAKVELNGLYIMPQVALIIGWANVSQGDLAVDAVPVLLKAPTCCAAKPSTFSHNRSCTV
jgi:hypothetical protein